RSQPGFDYRTFRPPDMRSCGNCASSYLVCQQLSCARVAAMLFVQGLAEFLQHSSPVGRTQRLQCYRDCLALDIEVARGLKDLLYELAPFLFCMPIMRTDQAKHCGLDPIRHNLYRIRQHLALGLETEA